MQPAAACRMRVRGLSDRKTWARGAFWLLPPREGEGGPFGDNIGPSETQGF